MRTEQKTATRITDAAFSDAELSHSSRNRAIGQCLYQLGHALATDPGGALDVNLFQAANVLQGAQTVVGNVRIAKVQMTKPPQAFQRLEPLVRNCSADEADPLQLRRSRKQLEVLVADLRVA